VTGTWVNVGSGTSWAVNAALQPATTYLWQVRALNASGVVQANGGVWWQFTTANAPGSPIGAFAKAVLAHTATYVPTNTTLSWETAAGVVRYSVGTQPGLCNVMDHAEVFSPTLSLGLVNAQPGQTYWWQIFAHSDGNLRLADAWQRRAFSTTNDTASEPENLVKTRAARRSPTRSAWLGVCRVAL